MKRKTNDADTFTVLPLLSDYAAAAGLSLMDDRSILSFTERLTQSLRTHLKNPARIYGLRTEAMFAYVAAALDRCQLITQEDAGTFFARAPSMRRPDFRVITRDKEEFLVEVKNFHQGNPLAPYKVAGDYATSLQRYAKLMRRRLMLAVYWSRWGIWTLVDFAHLSLGGYLAMGDALRKNEMGLLGDCMVSTVPPLSLRFTADPTKPRTIHEDGHGACTIGRADLCANGQVIEDALEKKLAWFFMLYGQWTEIEQPANVKDGKLEYFEITANPPEPPEGQPFSSLGFLSQMISRQYVDITSEGSDVKSLTPHREPENLGVLIPKDYKGEVLKLWRFQMLPNLKDVPKMESSQEGPQGKTLPRAP